MLVIAIQIQHWINSMFVLNGSTYDRKYLYNGDLMIITRL